MNLLEEQKKKARELGYSDQEISSYLAQRDNVSAQPAQPPQSKVGGGLRGWLTSLISEGGSTGGAAAGAAAGTAIAPGIGTLIGAGLGGLAGGFGGSAVEQKVRDDNIDWGKAAGEGAVSGITSAIMPGASLARSAAKGAATTAVESAAKKPALIKMADSLTKSGSGLKVGGNVGDVNRLGDATDMFRRLGITGSPSNQLRKINDVMASHSAQVDDILSKNPIKVNGADVKAQVAQAIDDPLKYAELDLTTPGAQKYLSSHLDKFAQATDAKQINDYVKVLNKTASSAQNKLVRGSTLTDKETAALAAKKAGDEVLSQFPEIKPLKQDMATLFEFNPQVAKESERAIGIPIAGIKSRTVAQRKDAIVSGAGDIAGKIGNVTQTPAWNTIKMSGKGIAAQGVGRFIAGTNQSPDNTPMNQSTPQTTQTDMMIPASNPNIQQSSQNTENSSSPFSDPAQVEQAYYKALNAGDTASAAAILKGYETFGAKANEAATKPLSAEASKVISNANSGLTSIDQLEQAITSDPSVIKKTLIPGRDAFGGLVGNMAGTSYYDTAARNISDVITRLRTGAAMTESEEKYYKKMLPVANDSPEVVQQKLQMFRDLFSSVANRTGSAGTDMQQTASQ